MNRIGLNSEVYKPQKGNENDNVKKVNCKRKIVGGFEKKSSSKDFNYKVSTVKGKRVKYTVNVLNVHRQEDNTKFVSTEQLKKLMVSITNIEVPPNKVSFLEKEKNKAIENIRMLLSDDTAVRKNMLDCLCSLLSMLLTNYMYPKNLSTVMVLTECGVGLNKAPNLCELRIPPELLDRALKNTDQEIILEMFQNSMELVFPHENPGYLETFKQYIPCNILKDAFKEFDSVLAYDNYSYKIAKPNFKYCLPVVLESLNETITSMPISELLSFKWFIMYVCILELNAEENCILIKECISRGGLSQAVCETLYKVSVVLGQSNFYKVLSDLINDPEAILSTVDNNGNNLLHLMASSIPEILQFEFDVPYFEKYEPDYNSVFGKMDIAILASQKNNSGLVPLQMFYQSNTFRISSLTYPGSDTNFVKSRRNFLLQHTAKDCLSDCMATLLPYFKGRANVNWFREFLLLFSVMKPGGCLLNDLDSVPSIRPKLYQEILCEMEINLFQEVKALLLKGVDALSEPDFIADLINDKLLNRKSKWGRSLPVEYYVEFISAILNVVSPDVQMAFFTKCLNEKNKFFITNRFSLRFRGSIYYYPWHLIALGLLNNYPGGSDERLTKRFLSVVDRHRLRHTQNKVKLFPEAWINELELSKKRIPYGRSLAYESHGVKSGYRRLKFRKFDLGKTENWNDFIREQVHLDFFFKQRKKIGLESQLLKPRGIFRLADARNRLQQFGLKELSLVAIEKDGSVFVQVFDDTKNSRLYHRYPYDVEGEAGLSMHASLEGVLLFSRDAGRLSHMGFKAPDTLSSYHNSTDQRSWTATPFLLGRSGATVPGTLGEWNVQDFPNISPAPVGMRDWADIRTLEEEAVSFARNLSFDHMPPDRERLLQVSELGKTFYGLIINWLRVRHDTKQLDYENKEQMQLLKREILTIAAALFGPAYGVTQDVMASEIRKGFPDEALERATLECAYSCDPLCRYVQDLRNKRMPDWGSRKGAVLGYKQVSDKSFCKESGVLLTDEGIMRSLQAKGRNLGTASGNLPFCHVDSLYWFCKLTGWLWQQNKVGGEGKKKAQAHKGCLLMLRGRLAGSGSNR